ncbi:MAG: Maf family protein [bacterium]|nr:Maf family protein [bacterium]
MKAKSPRVILASGSARRKEILEKAGLKFEVVPSDYEEDMTLPLPPAELVKTLAFGKANDVASRFPDAVVIGADTVVVLEGKVMGKPHTSVAAQKMLSLLSGTTHEIVTGVAVVCKGSGFVAKDAVSIKITFKDLTEEAIKNYVQTGEPLDKAGAYAVQGVGMELIEKVDGDYWGAVGISLAILARHLKVFGLSVELL